MCARAAQLGAARAAQLGAARAAQLGAARAIINFTCLKLEIFAVGWSMKKSIRGEKS